MLKSRLLRLLKTFVYITSLFILSIMILYTLCLNVCAEDADRFYRGWLIMLPENRPLLFSSNSMKELDGLGHGVYLTEDWTVAEGLLNSGVALLVEPNYPVYLFSDSSEASWSYESVGGGYANSLGLDGTGIRIGIIDSGIQADNKNLEGAAILDGYDYIRHSTKMTDDVGHGTYVAQVIAGTGNGGVTGLARGAELVPLRCFSSSQGDVASTIRAIYDAVDIYGCDVLNMSWGTAENSAVLQTAIEYASNAGVVLVAAAGNVNYDAPQGTLFYPAAYSEVIGVGAVDKTMTISAHSQQTEAVTVCAPGEGLIFQAFARNGREVASGTSFAAPCIAAEAALLRQLSPGMDGGEISALLAERAEDYGEKGYDTAYGWGVATMPGLLSEPWYRLVFENNFWRMEGWYCWGTAGILAAAAYDETGKMLTAQVSSESLGAANFSLRLPEESSATVKLMVLGGEWKPKNSAVIIGLS